MQMDGNGRLILPKNIRQMGTFGDTYRVYVEDFVYTYVHQFLHQRKKDETVLAAVLLGKTVSQDGQEYIFINGAQKVEFPLPKESATNGSGQAQNGQEQMSAGEKTGNGMFGYTDGLRSQETRTIPGQAENHLENHGMTEYSQTQTPDATTSAVTGVQTSRTEQSADTALQQEFWNRVYQRIKESFDDCEILGWYFNLDGSGLEVHADLQKFFESTYRKGSRFLYYEDSVEKEDAFFVQEQHRLQRLSGYAVYYEKNPQMQEFMIAERERMTPKPLRESYRKTDRDEVVENYRAIMNKLNEKPTRKKLQPVVYVAGAAVLAVVVAMGVGQLGNYQNLKVLEQTMQTLSKAVGGEEEDLSVQEEGTGIVTGADVSADDGAEGTTDGESTSDQTEVAGVSKDDSVDSTSNTVSGGATDDSTETTGDDSASAMTGNSTGTTSGDSASATTDNSTGTSAGGSMTASDSADNAAASNETSSENAEAVATDTAQSSGSATQTENSTQTVSASDSQTADASTVSDSTATSSPSNYYIVQKGDSLASISRKLYGTTDKIQELCNLNAIENMDVIYEGQKLLLP